MPGSWLPNDGHRLSGFELHTLISHSPGGQVANTGLGAEMQAWAGWSLLGAPAESVLSLPALETPQPQLESPSSICATGEAVP